MPSPSAWSSRPSDSAQPSPVCLAHPFRHGIEVGLRRPAVGAAPIVRQVFEGRARRRVALRLALGAVVDVAAPAALIACHRKGTRGRPAMSRRTPLPQSVNAELLGRHRVPLDAGLRSSGTPRRGVRGPARSPRTMVLWAARAGRRHGTGMAGSDDGELPASPCPPPPDGRRGDAEGAAYLPIHSPPVPDALGGGRCRPQGDREGAARRHLLGGSLRRGDARRRARRRQRLLPGLQPGDDPRLHRRLRRLGAGAADRSRLPGRDSGQRRPGHPRLPHRLRLGPRDPRHDLGTPRLPLQGQPGDLAIVDEAAFVDDLGEVLKAAMAFRVWAGGAHVISTHNGEAMPSPRSAGICARARGRARCIASR